MVFILLAASLFAGGCSMTAPKYNASIENVQKIKDAAVQPVKVGAFESTPGSGNANPISIRSNPLSSPYDGSYAKYLAEALRQELSIAGKLAPDSTIEISGALQKNDIDVPALSSATGQIAARFVVTRAGQVRYDQVKAVTDTWESSFVGAVAIPRAVEHYSLLVQKLLGALFDDPAFVQALR
jgi:hypothetical protein